MSVGPYPTKSTVHLVGIDSTGSSGPPMIAVETEREYFLSADNGVLTYALSMRRMRNGGIPSIKRIIRLTREKFWLAPFSPTFRARDILAPVAGRLSLGEDVGSLGEPTEQISRFEFQEPRKLDNETIQAHVIHIDRFGNVMTNLHRDRLSSDISISATKHSITIAEFAVSYADVKSGEALCLIGSTGYVGISIRDGNAASRLNIQIGDSLEIHVSRNDKG